MPTSLASLAPPPAAAALRIAPSTLAATAARLARAAVWKSLTPLTETERWYALLAATDRFEAWVIGWPVGGAIELHDHGGSSGAIHVVRGALEEASTNRVLRTPLARARVGEDEVVTFGTDHVHDLVNVGDAPALSIHVYAPRLVSMTFYDDRPASFLDVIRHEALDGSPLAHHGH